MACASIVVGFAPGAGGATGLSKVQSPSMLMQTSAAAGTFLLGRRFNTCRMRADEANANSGICLYENLVARAYYPDLDSDDHTDGNRTEYFHPGATTTR
ncbi:MAG: hypothetical protein R2856_26680 [Caldilineaceae bacterium]